MPLSQQEKAASFRALHEGEAFAIPNPWDAGSARVMEALGRATDLPVSVDIENGYGPDPDDAATAVTRIAEAGAVGGSIEDFDPEDGIYAFDRAVERVAAAVEAARRLDFPFTLTARAENYVRGNPDLDDTIARLQAYEKAGADVLYVPRLGSTDQIRDEGDLSGLKLSGRVGEWLAP